MLQVLELEKLKSFRVTGRLIMCDFKIWHFYACDAAIVCLQYHNVQTVNHCFVLFCFKRNWTLMIPKTEKNRKRK